MNCCKYCNLEGNSQLYPFLNCKTCCKLVHLDCLNKKTPGGFEGDVFFDFTCKECSPSNEELFERGKMSWFHCLVVVLYDLKVKCSAISNQGYFHWRTHIGTFINKNWNILFHPMCKMKKNWAGTFSGTLSQFSPIFFKSGSDELGQSGWWKLSHDFSPAMIKYISSEIINIKQNEKLLRSESSQANKEMEYAIFKQLVTKIGLTHLLSTEKQVICNSKSEKVEHHTEHIDEVGDNNYIYKNEFQTSGMENYLSNYFPDGEESLSDFDSIPPDFDEYMETDSNSHTKSNKGNYSDYNNATNSYLSSGDAYDSDNTSHDNYNKFSKFYEYSEESDDSKNSTYVHSKKKCKLSQQTINIPLPKSLFHQESDNNDSTTGDLPWLDDYKRKDIKEKQSLVVASQYEEVQMLNHLNNVCRKSQFTVDKKLIRLRAKLALRKLKRNKHILPEFNIDSLVCRLAKFPVQDYIKYSSQLIRVLDRYQQFTENLSGVTMPANVNFATRLTGSTEMTSILSPYSGKSLKPYIRRDLSTKPPWVNMLSELMLKVNCKDSDPYKVASLDYCYVRPHFIPSINSLCQQYFWPGIDLTETLQYPEFSCVVLYKKLIIGFAFLVPDVTPNEVYLSFIFTRPQWRRSGIAKFMLYHLIQTCIHKDITLHVSATNPAVLLYQTFGFKIEELVQDFYEKYYPAESMECKHALYLRLNR